VLFLYTEVLGLEIGPLERVPRPRMPAKLPVVLSREEVGQLLKELDRTMWLIGAMLYGTGVRLEECLELRVKDLDFERNQVMVRRGKGQKDRVTMLPGGLKERLTAHLLSVRRQHDRDLASGRRGSAAFRWADDIGGIILRQALSLIVLCLVATFPSACGQGAGQQNPSGDVQAQTQEGLPIIDMHMHAYNALLLPDGTPVPVPCEPQPCQGAAAAAKSSDAILQMTLQEMDKYNVVKGFLSSDNLSNLDAWTKMAPHRFVPSPLIWEPGICADSFGRAWESA
jgi:Phage integrase family